VLTINLLWNLYFRVDDLIFYLRVFGYWMRDEESKSILNRKSYKSFRMCWSGAGGTGWLFIIPRDDLISFLVEFLDSEWEGRTLDINFGLMIQKLSPFGPGIIISKAVISNFRRGLQYYPPLYRRTFMVETILWVHCNC
jgi:hypothetical protein